MFFERNPLPVSRSARGTKYNVEQPRANDYQDQVQVAQSTALVVSPESVAQWDLCLESFVWHPPQSPLSSGYGSSLFSADARLFMLFDK